MDSRCVASRPRWGVNEAHKTIVIRDWWMKLDLNQHALRRRILSPLCLPVSPFTLSAGLSRRSALKKDGRAYNRGAQRGSRTLVIDLEGRGLAVKRLAQSAGLSRLPEKRGAVVYTPMEASAGFDPATIGLTVRCSTN